MVTQIFHGRHLAVFGAGGDRDRVAFGVATGRRLELALEALHEWSVPIADVFITSVGTEINYGPNLILDRGWARHIDYQWDRDQLQKTLAKLPGLKLQPDIDQRRFKLSYFVDPDQAPSTKEIKALLAAQGLQANVIYSHHQFLDLLPVRASKGAAIRYFSEKWGIPIEHVLVSGDSGNDEDMIRGNALGVVVGNFHPDLEKLQGLKRIYFAEGEYAAGILEGMAHYDFLGVCHATD